MIQNLLTVSDFPAFAGPVALSCASPGLDIIVSELFDHGLCATILPALTIASKDAATLAMLRSDQSEYKSRDKTRQSATREKRSRMVDSFGQTLNFQKWDGSL